MRSIIDTVLIEPRERLIICTFHQVSSYVMLKKTCHRKIKSVIKCPRPTFLDLMSDMNLFTNITQDARSYFLLNCFIMSR